MVLPSPRNTRVFRLLGVLFALLGMGAFAKYAPWSLLHKIPPFASQHVPTRFMLMGLLFSGIDAAATFGALLDGFLRRFPRLKAHYRWFDTALLIGVVMICHPMFNVSRQPIAHTFERRMLPITPAERFQHAEPTAEIDYEPSHWFGAVLPAMFANIGADSECHTVPRPEIGAIMKESKRYRGEAYFRKSPGNAEVVHFTPNSAEVKFYGSRPDSVLVYNMNYHPGWYANDEPAINVRNAVGYRVSESSGTVRFTYRPPGLTVGLAIGAVFVFVLAWARFGATIRQRIAERVRERQAEATGSGEPVIGA
jgi:hypothetical protein